MIRRVVAFTGTARPRPTPATAVLIPTTCECASASAPPELPGFRAASVWITSSTSRAAAPLRAGRDPPPTHPRRRPAAGRQRPPDRAHHAGRHRASQAERAAHGHHELADDQVVRLAELGRRRRGPARPHHSEIGQRVGADHGERGTRAVGELRGPALATPHDVSVGQQAPIASEHDGRAEALPAPPPPPPPRPPLPSRRPLPCGTRRLATFGVSSAATPETTREYASSSPDSISSSRSR